MVCMQLHAVPKGDSIYWFWNMMGSLSRELRILIRQEYIWDTIIQGALPRL